MHKHHHHGHKNHKKKGIKILGFTLIELLITIAILGLITGVTLSSIKSSKDKAVDAEIKTTLSETALKVEGKEVAPGVIDYNQAFSSAGVQATVDALATKLGLPTDNYEYASSTNEFAVVFPLKKGGYYCVDSQNKTIGKEVTGLFATTGPKNCDNATRVVATDWGKGDTGGGGGQSVPQNPAARTLEVKRLGNVPAMGPTSDYYFYESLPRGYYDDPSKKWPLLIYMHGAGERPPANISAVLTYGPPKHISDGNQMEYVVNGNTESFVMMAVHTVNNHPFLTDATIEYAKANYSIDPKRIYLTGISAGSAYGFYYPAFSTQTGTGYSQKIAAVAVSDGISGGILTTLSYAGVSRNLDYCYLNNAGIPINLSYTTGGHNPSWSTGMWAIFQACPTPMHASSVLNQYTTGTSAWVRAFDPTNAYKTPNLYEWLLAQKRP